MKDPESLPQSLADIHPKTPINIDLNSQDSEYYQAVTKAITEGKSFISWLNKLTQGEWYQFFEYLSKIPKETLMAIKQSMPRALRPEPTPQTGSATGTQGAGGLPMPSPAITTNNNSASKQ